MPSPDAPDALGRGDRKRVHRLAAVLRDHVDSKTLRRSVDTHLELWETGSQVPADSNAAAVMLGRLGGLKKTNKPKGPAALPKERRRQIAQKAARARWKKD